MTNEEYRFAASATAPKWAARILLLALFGGAATSGVLSGLHIFGNVEGIESRVCERRIEDAVREAITEYQKEGFPTFNRESAEALQPDAN